MEYEIRQTPNKTLFSYDEKNEAIESFNKMRNKEFKNSSIALIEILNESEHQQYFYENGRWLKDSERILKGGYDFSTVCE